MEVIILLSNIKFCTLTIKGTRDFKSIQTRLKCPLYSLFLVVAWAMMFVWLGNSTLLILRLKNIQSFSICWHWTLNDQVFNSNILFETCKNFFFLLFLKYKNDCPWWWVCVLLCLYIQAFHWYTGTQSQTSEINIL